MQNAIPLPPRTAAQSIAVPQSLDAVRSKLLQLIEALNSLLSQLHYLSLSTPVPSASQPGLLSYPELISRYNLLLSHFSSLGGLLSDGEQQQAQQRRKEDRGRDAKREKWEGSLVVPAEEVAESRDWVVGMLLRTKQTPAVEAHLQSLLDALPSSFTASATSAEAIAKHSALTASASALISQLKEREPGEDGEEWDWRGRVELEMVDGEGDGEGVPKVTKEAKGTGKGVPWTVQEVATYQRTGKLPASAQGRLGKGDAMEIS